LNDNLLNHSIAFGAFQLKKYNNQNIGENMVNNHSITHLENIAIARAISNIKNRITNIQLNKTFATTVQIFLVSLNCPT
jgi:hypothetical protein